MFKKIQQKSLPTRKKILIAGVGAISALLFPFWILNFQHNIAKKFHPSETKAQTSATIQNLKELKLEINQTLADLSKKLDQIQAIAGGQNEQTPELEPLNNITELLPQLPTSDGKTE